MIRPGVPIAQTHLLYGAIVVVPGSGTNSSGSVVEAPPPGSSSASLHAATPESNVNARADTANFLVNWDMSTTYPPTATANPDSNRDRPIERVFAMIPRMADTPILHCDLDAFYASVEQILP